MNANFSFYSLVVISLILTLLHAPLVAQDENYQDSTSASTYDSTKFDGHIMSSDILQHGLTLGGNVSRYFYGEIGYRRAYIFEAGGFHMAGTSMTYGAEFTLHNGKPVVVPKIRAGIFTYLFLDAGLSALYYTDFNRNDAVRIRPELGLKLFALDFNYGLNIGVYKNNFDRISRHILSVRYTFKLFQKIDGAYDRNGNAPPK